MLYNLLDGPCTESFGINVAEMAGFPEDVIREAKRKIVDLDTAGNPSMAEQSRDHLKKAKTAMDSFASLPVLTLPIEKLHDEMKLLFPLYTNTDVEQP